MHMRSTPCWISLVLAACGGLASENGDSGALRKCSVPAGTYEERFSLGSGGTGCADLATQTITITEDESIVGEQMGMGGGAFGLFDGGAGCTSSASSSTCTFTETCAATASGSTSHTSISLTFHGASAVGAESTDSTGGIVSSCNYSITMTQ